MPIKWTQHLDDQLRSCWGNMVAKQISLEMFGDAFHRCAIIGRARRIGLQKMDNPVKPIQWDDRFKPLWENGTTVTRLSHIYKCGNEAVRNHALALGLSTRQKIDRVRPKRGLLKKQIIPLKKPATDTSVPVAKFTGILRGNAWFINNKECWCGYDMPPGANRCYGMAHG